MCGVVDELARVLVTGAGGFIGRALCPALAARGHQVIAGLRRLGATPGGSQPLVLGEISPATDWSAALRGVTAVIHLAQRAHVGPDPTALAAEPATVAALLGAMAPSDTRRLVLVSSVKAMGEATAPGRPFRPDDLPRPGDAYGRAKLASEQAATAAARNVGVELVVIRPPLVYGPGVGANFAALLRLAASGLPLPFAALDNRRSLIFVGNLADLIATAAVHPAAARTWLAADAVDLTVAELIRRLAADQGRRARLVPLPRPVFAALRRLPLLGPPLSRLTLPLRLDAGPTRAALGWTPPYDVDTALALTARALAAAR